MIPASGKVQGIQTHEEFGGSLWSQVPRLGLRPIPDKSAC